MRIGSTFEGYRNLRRIQSKSKNWHRQELTMRRALFAEMHLAFRCSFQFKFTSTMMPRKWTDREVEIKMLLMQMFRLGAAIRLRENKTKTVLRAFRYSS